MNSLFGRSAPVFLAALVALAGLLVGCNPKHEATTSASCAYVVGDGKNYGENNAPPNSRVHQIVFPGKSFTYDSDYEVSVYVPCGPRNYITNDGTVKNPNGTQVGDRFTPTIIYTANGTAIKIWTSAYFELDQQDLETFYTFCFKYRCFSENADTIEVNSATKTWNNMLAENVGPAIDRAAVKAATDIQLSDKIWQTHDSDLYGQLGDAMSANFKGAILATSGYAADLFCGSGDTSGWKDPDKPGVGNFKCGQVRITVDRVEAVDPSLNAQASQQAQAQNRLNLAQQLYGPYAQQVLANQDTIAACKAAGTTCVVAVGGASVAVATPKQ